MQLIPTKNPMAKLNYDTRISCITYDAVFEFDFRATEMYDMLIIKRKIPMGRFRYHGSKHSLVSMVSRTSLVFFHSLADFNFT